MTALRSLRRLGIAAALVAGGCSPGLTGTVQDAATGEPIAGATVELGNVGWGTRGGQLVWDAAKTARTTTDATGAFAFDEDGGTSLRVAAAGRPPIMTSLCPRSPSLVRVGGPHPELRADERLLFRPAGDGGGTWRGDHGLTASGNAFDGGRELRIESAGGVRFVAGTGAIPAAPPLPYDSVAELDLTADCGWLFVVDGASPAAVVRVGPLAWEEEPGGPRHYVMLSARLPAQAGQPGTDEIGNPGA